MGIACCNHPSQSDSPLTNYTVKMEYHLSERDNSLCYSSSNCKYEGILRKPFLSKICEKNKKRKEQCKNE